MAVPATRALIKMEIAPETDMTVKITAFQWRWKYEYLEDGQDRYSLYDLAKDPSESQNLAAKNPERLKKMMRGMVRELESMNAVYPVKDGQTLEPIAPGNP